MRKPSSVVFLVGPTAVGKSAVAIELAQKLNAEIISCDAMQVYREASIASDKPLTAMRCSVVHHLIDIVSVEEEFNVARYRSLALAAIEDIRSRGKVPLVVGGSGMYMMALLDGLFDEGTPDAAARARLDAQDVKALYARLLSVDPVAAGKIKSNDKMRIVRALEIFDTTGIPISEQQKKRDGIWGKYDIRIIALERPREELYARVEARIDAMFAAGLVDEVKTLLGKKLSSTGSRIIGLPEVKGFLDGEYDLERAKYLMKLHTRHYVKRQMTWFRKDKRLEWVMLGANEAVEDIVKRILFLPRSQGDVRFQ
ncbi:MAG: tRNA (adenosine(37)-N6)-dimethylallyltransferase MiaA [Candidatus Omnitrophica bacterium]|nr:tRNA (adenosine(37)-N6)-dimethylallyltransferase MiaA [Candidatus Omnitrophota bacterium]